MYFYLVDRWIVKKEVERFENSIDRNKKGNSADNSVSLIL